MTAATRQPPAGRRHQEQQSAWCGWRPEAGDRRLETGGRDLFDDAEPARRFACFLLGGLSAGFGEDTKHVGGLDDHRFDVAALRRGEAAQDVVGRLHAARGPAHPDLETPEPAASERLHDGGDPVVPARSPVELASQSPEREIDVVVDDINAAVARATDAGGILESPVKVAKWGKLALMADPFGHGFCLVEFVDRGYDEIASAS